MRLVFCGTPQFAVPVLEMLVQTGHQVELVLTQPDRPKGRGMEVALSPVKERALRHGLTVEQPDKIKNNADLMQTLRTLAPEVIVVVGYGRIIPRWMLDLPRFGNINLHASLLPKYRGAAPIQWAIARAESVTGVTTMLLNEGLDTGDILLQQTEPVTENDTSLTLAPRLAAIGAELMQQTLAGLADGTIKPIPQDDSQATLAPILKREDGEISFARTAREIHNRLRGFQPWPGAYTTFRGKKLILHLIKPLQSAAQEGREASQGLSHAAEIPPTLLPGQVLSDHSSLLVACGQGTAFEVLELQLEGKKRLSARDFLAGHHLEQGEKLGSDV